MCRFNTPWVPLDETRIERSEDNKDEAKVNQRKKLIDKVLSYTLTINDLSDITLSEILKKSKATEEQYNNVLEFKRKQFSIAYKQKPCEMNIGPYNSFILTLFKSNMNI